MRKSNAPSHLFRSPKIINSLLGVPLSGCIKKNNNEWTYGTPGLAVCGAIFRNHRGFIHGCFGIFLCECFTFEGELLAVMNDINIAHQNGW